MGRSSKHRVPNQSPVEALKFQLEKRSKTFKDAPVRMEEGYYFIQNPENYVDIERERHLGYIKVDTYMGSLATIQEFGSLAEAKRHDEIQKRYDPNYLAHPAEYIEYNQKYALIFQKILRDFNGCWIHKHAKGEVSDADMLKILKKISRNMRYLLTEAESKRPHGNLRNGVGITPEVDTLFFNLGRADNAGMYANDIKDLHGFLEKILPTSKKNNSSIFGPLDRWMKFLSDACLQVTKDFTLVEESEIHPPYYNLNHVRLMLNHPSSLEVVDKLHFLANMHFLCKHANLLRDETFKNHLVNCYSQWNDCFIGAKDNSGFKEVYQYGVDEGNYVDKTTGILCVPTIVIFAHSCFKHYAERAQEFNIKNKAQDVTHKDHMDPFPTPSEIFAELDNRFPHD